MFAADGAADSNHPAEKFVERGFGAAFGPGLRVVDHHIGVDVAVAGVAETGHRQPMFFLEARGEFEQVFQPAARDDDVFVEFGQAGVAQGIGKFTPDFPDFLALGGTQAAGDGQTVSARRPRSTGCQPSLLSSVTSGIVGRRPS